MAIRTMGSRQIKWMAVGTGVCAALVISAVFDSADARSRRKSRAPAYAPAYASIVVDANTGKLLQATNPDAHRHPASITKVMTLYMLFEQLEKRRISLNSQIPMTVSASRMPPTKIGLRPGMSISVNDAIKAVVTKSANDVAAAIGEHLGGSEEQFARMMTAKARSLGMSRTLFRNASGLPDPEQVTTARDLSVLGRAMRERFPQYYHFFATPEFRYGKARMRNHNRLLGRIEGVDGIKTGYTRASGFNLLTSARRGNRRIVAVVLGGRSGGSRDAIMAKLVENHIDNASGRRTATMIAERPAAETPERVAEAAPAPVPVPIPAPARQQVAEVAPARPAGRPLALSAYANANPVRNVRPAVISVAALSDTGDLVPTATIPQAPAPRAPAVIDGSTRGRTVSANAGSAPSRATTPATLRWASGPSGAPRRYPARPEYAAPAAPVPPAAIPAAESRMVPPARIASRETRHSEIRRSETAIARSAPKAAAAPQRPAAARSGMMIQVGATDDMDKAKALLAKAKSKGQGHLARATPFTEEVAKGSATLYRARFAGLSESHAEAACRALKKSGMGCFTTRN